MSEIPTSADAFKSWADRECPRWPSELQAQAYRAYTFLLFTEKPEYEIFKKQFAEWQAVQKPADVS